MSQLYAGIGKSQSTQSQKTRNCSKRGLKSSSLLLNNDLYFCNNKLEIERYRELKTSYYEQYVEMPWFLQIISIRLNEVVFQEIQSLWTLRCPKIQEKLESIPYLKILTWSKLIAHHIFLGWQTFQKQTLDPVFLWLKRSSHLRKPSIQEPPKERDSHS